MPKTHLFVIRINDRPYPLFKNFSFGRNLKLMASGFEITLIDPEQDLLKAFRPGVSCQIEIDDQILAKGYIDKINFDDSNGNTYTYFGRDRAGDLVDCSAIFKNGGFERANISLDDAVRDVLALFNMDLTVIGGVGKKFSKLSITPGETVLDFIDTICKYRAMSPLSDGVGGLILTSVSDVKSGGVLDATENGNVITRSAEMDHQSRHSHIIVKGQADGGGIGDISAAKLSGSQGLAYDPDIKRYRPLIVQAESEGYDLDMTERALWEVRHRRYAGTKANYTVQGWEAFEGGDFWKVNTTVPVIDPQLMVERDMLISDVKLYRSEQGTLTNIGVAPSEAYDIPANRQDSDDALWGGGA